MPFLLFAFVATITPGPTNILVLSNSQHYGVKATISALVSGSVAASAIVLISGAGGGEGDKSGISHHRGDGALSTRHGAVPAHLCVGSILA